MKWYLHILQGFLLLIISVSLLIFSYRVVLDLKKDSRKYCRSRSQWSELSGDTCLKPLDFGDVSASFAALIYKDDRNMLYSPLLTFAAISTEAIIHKRKLTESTFDKIGIEEDVWEAYGIVNSNLKKRNDINFSLKYAVSSCNNCDLKNIELMEENVMKTLVKTKYWHKQNEHAFTQLDIQNSVLAGFSRRNDLKRRFNEDNSCGYEPSEAQWIQSTGWKGVLSDGQSRFIILPYSSISDEPTYLAIVVPHNVNRCITKHWINKINHHELTKYLCTCKDVAGSIKVILPIVMQQQMLATSVDWLKDVDVNMRNVDQTSSYKLENIIQNITISFTAEEKWQAQVDKGSERPFETGTNEFDDVNAFVVDRTFYFMILTKAKGSTIAVPILSGVIHSPLGNARTQKLWYNSFK